MTLDTTQIRARADAATPGPWWSFFDGDDYGICGGENSVAYDVGHKNAQFIAAARTDIPALCDEVDALRKRAAELKACVANLVDIVLTCGLCNEDDDCVVTARQLLTK